jgi:hypothetical protein
MLYLHDLRHCENNMIYHNICDIIISYTLECDTGILLTCEEHLHDRILLTCEEHLHDHILLTCEEHLHDRIFSLR